MICNLAIKRSLTCLVSVAEVWGSYTIVVLSTSVMRSTTVNLCPSPTGRNLMQSRSLRPQLCTFTFAAGYVEKLKTLSCFIEAKMSLLWKYDYDHDWIAFQAANEKTHPQFPLPRSLRKHYEYLSTIAASIPTSFNIEESVRKDFLVPIYCNTFTTKQEVFQQVYFRPQHRLITQKAVTWHCILKHSFSNPIIS